MKKTFYIFCASIFGLLFSVLLYTAAEMVYVRYAISEKASITWYALGNAESALPIWVLVCTVCAGVIGGYFLGRCWWRIVYIEKRHWRFHKEKSL